MGCAPSSKAAGNRVAMAQLPDTAEENNNHRLSMDASNFHNEEIKKQKPVPAEIYGAVLTDVNVAPEDDIATPDKRGSITIYGADLPDKFECSNSNIIYGSTLPDQTNEEFPEKGDNMCVPNIEKEKQEVHVITHSNKSVSFGKNETDNDASMSANSTYAGPERLTAEVLNEFIELDGEIQELEANHTEEKLTLHQMEYTNIEQALKLGQLELEQLKKNVDDEEENLLDCSFYMQSHQLRIMTDENSEGLHNELPERKRSLESLEAKNKHEVCEKQLEALQDKLHKISEAVEISLKQVDDLTCKRLKLNGLLENVFNGHYGSNLENRLELETEQLLQYKQHVSVAHFKWWNGRLLINHAVTQMAITCKRWKEIQHSTEKYQMATDARNNLVATHQNCLRTEEYLKLHLPYWTPEDNKNIVDSINRLYADTLSSASYQKAYSWFYYYHQRLGLQLNWMDQVINNKIVTDYQRVSQEFKVKYRELRKERLRLIQEKAKEILHIDWDIEPFLMAPGNENDDTDTLPMVGSNTALTEEISIDLTADTVSLPRPAEDSIINTNENSEILVTSDDAVNIDENNEGPPLVRRLSLSELAPTPKDSELFGNVKQLETMHRKQIEAFDKVQELNKAKQEQGLKEKLRERQSKRRKQMLQQIQETALSATSAE